MRLKALCDAAEIDCPIGHEEDEILSIVTDSRRVCPDCLFVCVRGFTLDGHNYLSDAVFAGARWVLSEEGSMVDQSLDVTYLWAKDTRRALSFLFHAWYGLPCNRLHMIGVTGTNGKTTVTHMIEHILRSAGYRCGLIGTLGARLGEKCDFCMADNPLANMTTPDPEMLFATLAEMERDGAEYVVMEVSSHALALEKVVPIVFEVGIFTNLTPEHLDFHSDMTAYAEAKAKLFLQSRCAIVNMDSPQADRMIAAANEMITCSVERTDVDCYAEDISLKGTCGVSYRLVLANESLMIHSSIPGLFTVANSMQAAICARLLGVDGKTVVDAIATLSGVRGRMERLPLPDELGFSVLIDYAHTPDALENLLCTVRKMRENKGRIVLLFGCGGDRDRSKRSVMGKIASELADLVVLTSDNSRSEDRESILRQILSGCSFRTSCHIICNRREAIFETVLNARRGDIILLAGKGHEEYEIDRSGKHPFSERAIVMEAIEEKHDTLDKKDELR